MPLSLSTSDLVKARESVNKILEELQLDAYLFEIEPRDETWELNIECACEIDGSWKSFTIQVPKQFLIDGFDDDREKQRLFEFLKMKVVECKVQQI